MSGTSLLTLGIPLQVIMVLFPKYMHVHVFGGEKMPMRNSFALCIYYDMYIINVMFLVIAI